MKNIIWKSREELSDEFTLILSPGTEIYREVKTTTMPFKRLRKSAQKKANVAKRTVELWVEWIEGPETILYIAPE